MGNRKCPNHSPAHLCTFRDGGVSALPKPARRFSTDTAANTNANSRYYSNTCFDVYTGSYVNAHHCSNHNGIAKTHNNIDKPNNTCANAAADVNAANLANSNPNLPSNADA